MYYKLTCRVAAHGDGEGCSHFGRNLSGRCNCKKLTQNLVIALCRASKLNIHIGFESFQSAPCLSTFLKNDEKKVCSHFPGLTIKFLKHLHHEINSQGDRFNAYPAL